MYSMGCGNEIHKFVKCHMLFSFQIVPLSLSFTFTLQNTNTCIQMTDRFIQCTTYENLDKFHTNSPGFLAFYSLTGQHLNKFSKFEYKMNDLFKSFNHEKVRSTFIFAIHCTVYSVELVSCFTFSVTAYIITIRCDK